MSVVAVFHINRLKFIIRWLRAASGVIMVHSALDTHNNLWYSAEYTCISNNYGQNDWKPRVNIIAQTIEQNNKGNNWHVK